jgi:pyrroloquinoline-quinone synthase
MTTLQTTWTTEEFEAQLRAKSRNYHIHHPFNVKMNSGQCSRAQIQGWVLNRFYYQWCIPIKDAAIMSNCPDRETRRKWIARILDHDGFGEYQTDTESGGMEAWTQLGLAVGLERDALWSLKKVEPAVKFACDAYVNFARQRPWQEAVCSSLTEMFAPQIHKDRLATWPTHYPWIESAGLNYFRKRIPLAQRDVEHGLSVTLDYFKTREQQEYALEILQFKLDVLWSMLDAIERAYPE